MNTSFNGPGQPIVETYEDAIEFFINSELDNLYIENFEIKKEHKMTILGIHCGFSIHTHEPGAALIKNGKIISVCEEERLIRVKNALGYLPTNSIKQVLAE